MAKKVKESPKERRVRIRESLRTDVLAVIQELEEPRDEGARVFSSHLRDIMKALRDKGWTASDFKRRWGSDDFERAVDAALQYHRRAGRIEFWSGHGWETKR